jgi:hypothetical protein
MRLSCGSLEVMAERRVPDDSDVMVFIALTYGTLFPQLIVGMVSKTVGRGVSCMAFGLTRS